MAFPSLLLQFWHYAWQVRDWMQDLCMCIKEYSTWWCNHTSVEDCYRIIRWLYKDCLFVCKRDNLGASTSYIICMTGIQAHTGRAFLYFLWNDAVSLDTCLEYVHCWRFGDEKQISVTYILSSCRLLAFPLEEGFISLIPIAIKCVCCLIFWLLAYACNTDTRLPGCSRMPLVSCESRFTFCVVAEPTVHCGASQRRGTQLAWMSPIEIAYSACLLITISCSYTWVTEAKLKPF